MKRICAALLLIACSASADTITFEGGPYAGVFNSGDSLLVDNYKFTLNNILAGFIGITNQSNIVETNTTKLYGANDSEIIMSKSDGAAFDLLDFDVGGSFTDDPLGPFFSWASAVTVIGTFAGGGSISETVNINQSLTYTHATLGGFSGLKSVRFTPLPNVEADQWSNPWRRNFTLDNIEVQPASVPDSSSSVELLGIALAGFAAIRHFRRAYKRTGSA